MVIDCESIEKHLELLRNFVAGVIKAKNKLSVDEIKKNLDSQSMIAYPLIQAVQSCLDIGNHIVSELNLRRADSYAEVFEILTEENIMSVEISNKLMGFVRLRNQITHLYGKVDWEKIYLYIDSDINIFNAFEKEIVTFLENNSKT